MNPLTFNQNILRNYTDQPAELPPALRSRMEALCNGRLLQLYALADLDSGLKLTQQWIALDAEQVLLADGNVAPEAAEIRVFPRTRVRSVRTLPGLSCSCLSLYGEANEPVLAELHYTRRQQHAVEKIKVVLEQDLELSQTDPDAIYAESVADPIKQAQSKVSGNDLAVVWRLTHYLHPYKVHLVAGLISAILLTALNLVPPYITGRIIDELTASPRRTDLAHYAWTMVGLLVAVYCLRNFFLWIRLRLMAKLGEWVAHDLRRDIYEHLQGLGLTFFSRKQTGSIISRVTSDTDRLWDFVAFGILEVSVSVIMLFGLGIVLVSMDWKLGLVMTLPVPLFLWAFFVHGRSINRIFLHCWRKWSGMTSLVSGTIPGIRVVKAFHQEQREKDRFHQRNQSYLDSANQVHDNWTTFWPFLMLGFHALTVLTWVFAIPRLTGQQSDLTTGTFVAFLLYVGMFLHPLEVIGHMTRMMNRAISSAYRIFEILDTEPDITNVEEPTVSRELQGAIEFRNVSFSYDGIRKVLKNISFAVRPGEMIGLVGPSGAGKSTITNLLARFYDVSDGAILVDGIDLRELEIGSYRRQMGMVLQEPYLFHGSLFENISYGLDERDPAAVIEAARAANAHDFICKLDQGYETMVGERGHTLSGGERQRISIARAILHNPKLLILDEATSNVDTETERNIQQALNRLVSGRTVIAIAHRLSTLKQADRLLVIKDGELVEEGTHDELLAIDGGVFQKLHDMQQELHEQFAI